MQDNSQTTELSVLRQALEYAYEFIEQSCPHVLVEERNGRMIDMLIQENRKKFLEAKSRGVNEFLEKAGVTPI